MDAAAPEPVADLAKTDAAKAMEKLEARTKAVVARAANSHISDPDERLHLLLSLKNGKPIDKFPATPAGIPKLGLTQIDAMLNALDADRTGNEEVKRERLRLQMGLKAKPV
ncbi:hypothetical protein B0A50_03574 [Salinomyces thailandicus]|uniref:Uncharacterized protein n=1 Tax=Salinomyces thailandicus TaxID=706561 RepID=A0A4U0U3E8_9PEZI|nr:hypothetical protein B0A50_03574 [Salinomyces thailandica]